MPLDCCFSASKGVKRKWSMSDESMDMERELPLCPWRDRSSNSTMSESSMDIELDFSQVDLELTLSSTPTSSVTSLSGPTHQQQQSNSSFKVCDQYTKCEKLAIFGGKKCKYDGCGKSGEGGSDFCKAHGALVRDERVHGGASLGPLVHDTKSGSPTTVVTSSTVAEGRVHGGSLIAYLAGNSGCLLD